MINSIALVKTSSLGDILHTFPVLSYLRNRFPKARIDWIAEKAAEDLLRAHPLLNDVHILDSKRWRKNLFSSWKDIRSFKRSLPSYDLVFDLQGNCKSAFVTACVSGSHKVGFGWKSVAEKPNVLSTHYRINVPARISVYERYLQLVKSYFQDDRPFIPQEVVLRLSKDEKDRLADILSHPCLQKRPLWILAPGSMWLNKQLPDSVLLDLVSFYKDPAFLIMFRGEEEEKRAQLLASGISNRALAVGNVSLPLIQGFMRAADFVISADSALLHLCATTCTPSFSFFGPSSHAIYKPQGDQHTAFQGTCPYHVAFATRCPRLRTCSTGACLRSVSFNQLFNSIQK